MVASSPPVQARNLPAIKTPYLKQFANAQGVAASSIATANIPPAGTFYEMYFRFLTSGGVEITKAQLEAECTDIRIRINGELIIDAKTSELNMIHKFYGDANVDDVTVGVLKIDWVRRNLNLPLEHWQYAIGTQGVSSIEVQFVTAAIPNLAIIECYALTTDEVRPVGPHLRIQATPTSFASAATHEFTGLPTTQGTSYLAMHIGLGSGTLTNSTLIVDDVQFVQTVPASVLKAVLLNHKRTPQTGYRHLSFDLFNEVMGKLNMLNGSGLPVQDFRLRNVWSVAPTAYRIVHERVYDVAAAA